MANVTELRKQAKDAGIAGASRLSKADLEKALAKTTPATPAAKPAETTEATLPSETVNNATDNTPEPSGEKSPLEVATEQGYFGAKKDPEPNSTHSFPNPGERV